jgi:hypothetical protein
MHHPYALKPSFAKGNQNGGLYLSKLDYRVYFLRIMVPSVVQHPSSTFILAESLKEES